MVAACDNLLGQKIWPHILLAGCFRKSMLCCSRGGGPAQLDGPYDGWQQQQHTALSQTDEKHQHSFSNKAEAFRWNHHYDRKHDQYGDKQDQMA